MLKNDSIPWIELYLDFVGRYDFVSWYISSIFPKHGVNSSNGKYENVTQEARLRQV